MVLPDATFDTDGFEALIDVGMDVGACPLLLLDDVFPLFDGALELVLADVD